MPGVDEYVCKRQCTINIDFELYMNALGIPLVASTPTELSYFSVTTTHFCLDQFSGQRPSTFELQNFQLDKPLVRSPCPVPTCSHIQAFQPFFKLGAYSSSYTSKRHTTLLLSGACNHVLFDGAVGAKCAIIYALSRNVMSVWLLPRCVKKIHRYH